MRVNKKRSRRTPLKFAVYSVVANREADGIAVAYNPLGAVEFEVFIVKAVIYFTEKAILVGEAYLPRFLNICERDG